MMGVALSTILVPLIVSVIQAELAVPICGSEPQRETVAVFLWRLPNLVLQLNNHRRVILQGTIERGE